MALYTLVCLHALHHQYCIEKSLFKKKYIKAEEHTVLLRSDPWFFSVSRVLLNKLMTLWGRSLLLFQMFLWAGKHIRTWPNHPLTAKKTYNVCFHTHRILIKRHAMLRTLSGPKVPGIVCLCPIKDTGLHYPTSSAENRAIQVTHVVLTWRPALRKWPVFQRTQAVTTKRLKDAGRQFGRGRQTIQKVKDACVWEPSFIFTTV